MVRKVVSVILVLLWMMIIFGFSKESGNESGSLSDNIIIAVTETVTDIKRDTKDMQNIIKKYSFFVRKCAHFTEYFILGFLVINALYICGVKRYSLIYTIVICILYAVSDEVHQLFVPGRSGQLSDTLLDSSASIFSSYLYHRLIIMKRGKNE